MPLGQLPDKARIARSPVSLAQAYAGDPGCFTFGERPDDHEGNAIRCARPVRAAGLAADDRADARAAVLVHERALKDVDDLLAAVMVVRGQDEARVPLDDRDVEILVQTQDLPPAVRRLRLPLDVVLAEITHAGRYLWFRSRHCKHRPVAVGLTVLSTPRGSARTKGSYRPAAPAALHAR